MEMDIHRHSCSYTFVFTCIQNTHDVTILKSLNDALIIEGDELMIVFGQILPLLLFVQFGFILVDLWQGRHDQKLVKKKGILTRVLT